MLISYEEKLRIAQESLRQPSVNQIAEATGIHRSVVQKALNDPEIIELQETLKIHLRSRYVNSLAVDTPVPRETQSKRDESDGTKPNEVESSNVESNEVKSSVSEAAELRIREVEALESIATSLASLKSVFETEANNADVTNQRIPLQEALDE